MSGENKELTLDETGEVGLNESLRNFESEPNETPLIEEEPAASEQVEVFGGDRCGRSWHRHS